MKNRNLEILYLISLAIFITSGLFWSLQNIFNIFEYIGYVLLFIKLVADIKYKKRNEIIKSAILTILCLITYLYSKDITLIKFLMLILAFKNVKFQKCVKTDMICRIISTGIIILLNYYNIIPDVNAIRGEMIRYSLGFSHPNGFASNLMMIYIDLIYIEYVKNNKMTKEKFIINTMISIILIGTMYYISNTRLTIIMIIIINLLYNIICINPQILDKRFIKKIVCNIFFINSIFTLLATILYNNQTNIGIYINKASSSRIYYILTYYKKFGISILGNNFIGFATRSMTLDNAFAHVLLRYGILMFSFILLSFNKIFKYLYEEKKYLMISILLVFCISGLFENGWLRIEKNIYMLTFYLLIENKNSIKKIGEKNIE